LANPQKENGYTPVANEIIEQLVKLPLNGTQLRIILVVWRYTYGFSRKEHELSVSFLANATGIHKKQIQRELKELIQLKIIYIAKEATFSSSRIIGFNKDYDSYLVTKKLPDSVKDTHTGSELVPSPGSELAPQDKQVYKTNIKATFDVDNEQYQLAILLRTGILKNLPKARVPDDKNLTKWAATIDKMIRLDKRTPEEIREVINFAITDEFWSTNILSASSLRKQFDRLTAQKNRNKKQTRASSSGYSQKRRVRDEGVWEF